MGRFERKKKLVLKVKKECSSKRRKDQRLNEILRSSLCPFVSLKVLWASRRSRLQEAWRRALKHSQGQQSSRGPGGGAAHTPTPTPHSPDTASIPQPPLLKPAGTRSDRGAPRNNRPRWSSGGAAAAASRPGGSVWAPGKPGRNDRWAETGLFFPFSLGSWSFSPGSHQQRPVPCDLQETTPTDRQSTAPRTHTPRSSPQREQPHQSLSI